jgi:hypothetical protein
MSSEEKQPSIRNIVKDVVNNILTPAEVELDEIKEEVWQDLSSLYYKYEDENQKRAFRELMCEISEKISEGKWDSVYKKLYRLGQKDKPF